MHKSLVKENVSWRAPLSSWWVCAALVASALALAGVTLIDHALPEPLTRATATSDHFIAEIAYEHLLNLTSIGPRVAGSYENEVSAVRVLVSAMREIENAASPHNRLEVELHSASGAFPLAFLDGMNNVYRGVQMVVVRVSGMGERTGARRSALLLNCHFDTVPDSPGASDDGAGCAVLLETVRALAVRSQPLRRDLILLLNGAEENILQASHGFITTHRWAKSVRAFLNIEACGAGGREVLFQAGPHDPWIMEVYAGAVPHPFASSLAQELFQSGLIPADTDYRIFRDFGNLSGVDLAWSANGYVYHTHLDTAENVPLATLQRTGDNVLALTQGLLQSEDLDSEVDKSSRQPVFFDVLGLVVVSARAPLALLVAVATVAVVILDVHLSALEANRELYVRSGWWWRAVLVALGGWARAQAAGVLAAASVALALHVLGARLSFYAHPWLLAPLYAAPALAAAWWCAARERVASEWGLRGWRGALAWRQAGSLWAAGALAACAATGLRSGFLPLLWALGPALPGALLVMARAPRGGWLAVSWALGATLPALQTWYLALGSLRMFVPVLGRAGAGPVPADVMMAVLVSSLVLTACSWILPLVVAARNQQRLVRALVYACVAGCLVALASPPSASYSAERPQRLMVFHVRRSVHVSGVAGSASEEPFFWVPELDVNTGRTLRAVLGQEVRPVHTEECERWPYCGVPYYLPVLTLIPTSYVMSAPALPAATLHVRLHSARLDDTTQLLQLNITGPSHVVLIVSPVPGVKLSWSSAVETPRPTRRHGSARDTYFFTLHEARAPALWHVDLHLRHSLGAEGDMQGGARWADVSVAGHSLFGEQKTHEVHRQLLERLPAWVAPTGWAVHLQLYRV